MPLSFSLGLLPCGRGVPTRIERKLLFEKPINRFILKIRHPGTFYGPLHRLRFIAPISLMHELMAGREEENLMPSFDLAS
jgi:hypothetical protein